MTTTTDAPPLAELAAYLAKRVPELSDKAAGDWMRLVVKAAERGDWYALANILVTFRDLGCDDE